MKPALFLSALLAALVCLPGARAAEVRDLIGECAYCHGDAGIAKDKDVPHLAGQQRAYLYNQLLAFRSGKRPHKEMRFMSRQMTNAEMEVIADYYASLPPR